jgi:hypothetical protein
MVLKNCIVAFGFAIRWLSASILTIATAMAADLPAPPSAAATAVVTPKAKTYTIGGIVIGLETPGTVKLLDKDDAASVSANGTFTLPKAVKSGTAYDVTLGTPPAGQTCAVQSGSGTVARADVTNVLVYCTYTQSDATLRGTYDGAGFNINNNTDLLSIGVPFNGSGREGATATLITDTNGTITTTTNSGSSVGRYSIVTTDAIPVLTTGDNNIGAVAGEDADELVWIADASTVAGGGLPALAVGVSPLQGGTVAELAGDWMSVGLQQGSDPQVFEATLTLGADGSVSGTSTSLDVNGVVTVFPYSQPAGTLTVASDGRFTDGSGTVGYVSANGEFIFATYTAGGEVPGLTVLVRQGTGLTTATLNGVYTVCSLAFATATTGDGAVLTLLFDGAGTFSGTFIDNDSGVITTGHTISGTYTVTSAGVVTITDAEGLVQVGDVSADGNILVAASLTGGGVEQPRMLVGFRQ